MNFILLRHFNFTAAGFATAATELLFLLCALIAFQRVTRKSALTWPAAVYLLPALAMAALLRVVPGSPAMRVASGIVLGGLSVAAILLSPATRQFRQEVAAASPS
jgi:hypothetical protein